MKKIGNLEKQSDVENPNWIPQVGDYYAWRESNTRHGDLIIGRVAFYNAERQIISGRKLVFSERRYLGSVFKLSEETALSILGQAIPLANPEEVKV